MESASSGSEGDDYFDDALDEFPFYDCSDCELDLDQPEQQSSSITSTSLRRRRFRRYSKYSEVRIDGKLFSDSVRVGREQNDGSSTVSEILERLVDNSSDSGTQGRPANAEDKTQEASVVTAVDRERVGDLADSVGELRETEAADSSLLIWLAAFVIKAIGFQFNILLSMFTLPFWCLYASFMFIMDPFSATARIREYLTQKLLSAWSLISETATGFAYDWLKEHKSIWELAVKCGWGLFWSIYVCSILFGLLVSATLVSGFVMRYLVQEPIRMEEKLNFDYTKNCPVAYMPIISCGSTDCGMKCKEMVEVESSRMARVILPNDKLLATLKLNLPESDYNRNLGVFQIRIDLLSTNGKTLASSSSPCILLFKSEPIRFLLTMLKAAPLIAGYISESQTIEVKFRGFVESQVPTSCLKVVVEQRAEFRPGAGIPELYDASLTLESELPLIRRVLWYWKRTVFIWISMVFFVMELLFMLICCRPIMLPRTRQSTR